MNDVFRIQAMMTLSDLVSGPISAIRQSFRAAGRDADGLAGRIGALGKRFAPFAIAAGLIVGGMTATALATADTSQAIGELATLGAKDLDMFRDRAMAASNQWAGVDAPAFITAAYDVRSALSNLSESAQADITEMAAVTAKATKATVEDMTSFIGKAYNIMGESTDFAGLSDVQIAEQLFSGMSASVKEFMTTGPAMRQSLMSMGNAATIAGIGISDQLAALGRLNNVMEASVAGTGFKTFVNKLPKVAEELGLNFRDAAGEMLPLPDILDMISGQVGDMTTNAAQIKVMTLFGEDAAATYKTLSAASDELRDKTVLVGDAMSSGREYVLEMASAANEHLGASIQIMNQRISGFIQIVGSMFVPIVNSAVQFVSWLALSFQKLASVIAGNPFLTWVVQITLLLALVGSMIGMFGALSIMLPGIITLVKGYAVAMWAAASAQLAVTWPIYAVIAALGLLVLAYRSNFLGIGDTLRGWYDTVRIVFDGVRAVFASLRGRDYEITGELAGQLRSNGLVGIVDFIAGVLYRLWQVMLGVRDVALWVGKVIGTPLWLVFSSTISSVASAFKYLWSAILTVVTPIIQLIGLINPVVWRAFGVVIGTVVAVALAGLLVLLSPLIFAIGKVVAIVWIVAKAFQGWGMLIDLVIATVFDGFQKLANFDWGSLLGIIGEAISSLNLFDAGQKLWKTLIDGIKAGAGGAVDAVMSVMGRIGNLLPHSDAKEGPLSTLTQSGRSLMGTISDGVRSAAPALRASVGVALTAGMIPLNAGASVSQDGIVLNPVEITVPAPDIRQESVEITPSATLFGPSDPDIPTPDLTPLPEPVNRETVQERTVSVPVKQQASEAVGEVRHYHITINNPTFPGVTDARSFFDELARYIDAHDGGGE